MGVADVVFYGLDVRVVVGLSEVGFCDVAGEECGFSGEEEEVFDDVFFFMG